MLKVVNAISHAPLLNFLSRSCHSPLSQVVRCKDNKQQQQKICPLSVPCITKQAESVFVGVGLSSSGSGGGQWRQKQKEVNIITSWHRQLADIGNFLTAVHLENTYTNWAFVLLLLRVLQMCLQNCAPKFLSLCSLLRCSRALEPAVWSVLL